MDLSDYMQRVLSTSFEKNKVKCVPTMLLSASRFLESDTSEDTALNFYSDNGFAGARSRKNTEGYEQVFRELLSPPDWLEYNEIKSTPYCGKELPPFIAYVIETDTNTIIEEYISFFDKMMSASNALNDTSYQLAKDISLADLRQKILLARMLGWRTCLDIYKAIFYWDEDGLEDMCGVNGAPDLFVWKPDGTNGFWFFSEVKGKGDYLRDTQKQWVDSNWELVRGHYLLSVLI